jgi:multidrug transporter EmrE-like cation transporter
VQSALVVPFVLSMVVWREPLRYGGIAGVILVVTGIIVLGRLGSDAGQSIKTGSRWLLLAVLAFGCIGLQQTFCSIPSHWTGWEDSAGLQVPLIMLFTALGWLCLKLRPMIHPDTGGGIFPVLGICVFTLLSFLCLFLSLRYLRTEQMTSVVFPLSTGVNIVVFALYGRMILGERLSLAGVGLVLSGILALSF